MITLHFTQEETEISPEQLMRWLIKSDEQTQNQIITVICRDYVKQERGNYYNICFWRDESNAVEDKFLIDVWATAWPEPRSLKLTKKGVSVTDKPLISFYGGEETARLVKFLLKHDQKSLLDYLFWYHEEATKK